MIELNDLEMEWGISNGHRLYEHSKWRRNGRPLHISQAQILADDIQGMLGEIAAAIYYDIQYEFQTDKFTCPDVARIQVKTAAWPGCDLAVGRQKRREYHTDHPFLRVAQLGHRTFLMEGWIMRSHGRTYPTRGDAHWVPVSELQPPASLPEEYKAAPGAIRTPYCRPAQVEVYRTELMPERRGKRQATVLLQKWLRTRC